LTNPNAFEVIAALIARHNAAQALHASMPA
jgi:hypothetical protein